MGFVSTPTPTNPAENHAPNDGSVTVFRVNPLVWKQALAAADGDARRIEIIDEMHVKIHNQRVR